jgi:glutamate racemase
MGLIKGPIGVFDSGFGGLEILRHIVKKLPQYDYIYLGDTARTPYGSRSQEVIYNFTKQAVAFLFKQKCPLVILACNTASCEALRKIQQRYLKNHYPQRRVLGVVIPASEAAKETTKNNRVGVIGTEGTINSMAFEREIKKINPKIKVFAQACPLLVPIVESGEHNTPIAQLALQKYLQPLLAKQIDTLILGCTHYGFLEKQIKKIVGQKIKIIIEGRVVAEKLADYLQRHQDIEKSIAQNQKRKFFTTDLTDKFQKLGSYFFGEPINPQKINLE